MKPWVLCTLLLSAIMVSCESSSLITLEVQRPAEVRLPADISSVLIVDNAAAQPENFGHSVYGLRQKMENAKYDAEYFRTLFLTNLETKLKQNKISKVELKRTRTKNQYTDATPLSEKAIAEIDSTHSYDLIISVDKFLLESALRANYIAAENIYRVTLDGYSKPFIRAYSLKDKVRTFELPQSDTLFWENFDYALEITVARFPSPKLCLADLMSYSVDHLYKKLFPNKEFVQRTIYESMHSNMMDAARYAKQNRWAEASYIWEYVYDNSKNKRVKGYCAANLAVNFEIIDQFDKATDWAWKAKAMFDLDPKSTLMGANTQMEKYIKDLKIRQKEVGILEAQSDY